MRSGDITTKDVGHLIQLMFQSENRKLGSFEFSFNGLNSFVPIKTTVLHCWKWLLRL